MHPIDLRLGGSTRGMSATQFRKKVVDICNEHRKEKRALVFAFLLFDRRHGQVARVLDDIRFYETLDEIAGSLLTVFFIHSEPLRLDRRKDAWGYQADEIAEVLTNQFEIGADWDREKPAILFFQVNGDRILDGRFASFEDERQEDTFIAMKRVLKTAAESIASVRPEFAGNSKEILDLVDNAIRSDAFYKRLGMVYKTVPVLTAIKGLLLWTSH